MAKVNVGQDLQALQVGGGGVGYEGTATATTSSSLTGTGTPWVASQRIGRYVVITSGAGVGCYGVISANTTTQLTVARWVNPASPGGGVVTISSTPTFTILPGGAPAYFMGISTNSSGTVTATDTTMASEITTSGGALIRYPAVYAHTTGSGSSTYTLTGTFTANSTDAGVGSQTVYRIGVFTDLTGGILMFETLISAPATFVAIGDSAVITQTVSM